MQDSHPVAYHSKSLGPKNIGLSAYEKECLALLFAIDHWRPYLQHSKFTIRTGQKSLLNLTNQRLNTPIQQRAFTKLAGLQFTIQYKTGVTNRAADALSRRDHPTEAEVVAISVCKPAWVEVIGASYRTDPEAQQRLTQLLLQPGDAQGYSLKDGIIHYQDCIWVGPDSEIQRSLITSLHDSVVGGHSGFHATYNHIKPLFCWKGMKDMIRQYIRAWVTC